MILGEEKDKENKKKVEIKRKSGEKKLKKETKKQRKKTTCRQVFIWGRIGKLNGSHARYGVELDNLAYARINLVSFYHSFLVKPSLLDRHFLLLDCSMSRWALGVLLANNA